MKKKKSVTITLVKCKGFEVIYTTESGSMNAEPVVRLDGEDWEKRLSYTRMKYFQDEFDAVGLWLAAH